MNVKSDHLERRSLKKIKASTGFNTYTTYNAILPGYPIDRIDINQYQSISINRLILIIDDQSMAKIRVVIDWYRLSISIDR